MSWAPVPNKPTVSVDVKLHCKPTAAVRRFGPLGTGSPRTATSTFKQLLELCAEHMQVQVQCCFTSTETIRTIWDWEPRAATSAFTKLRSSVGCFQIDSPVILFPDPERAFPLTGRWQRLSNPGADKAYCAGLAMQAVRLQRRPARLHWLLSYADGCERLDRLLPYGRMRTFRSAVTLRTDANV